jgi:hypothetical protein
MHAEALLLIVAAFGNPESLRKDVDFANLFQMSVIFVITERANVHPVFKSTLMIDEQIR